MMSRPWIKTPTARLNDARLQFVSTQARSDYFMLYLLAGQLDAEGLFFENGRRLTDKEIAFRIHTKFELLKKSYAELKRESLITVNGKGPLITDWHHEQINWREKQEEDRKRQARHRSVTRDSDGATRDGDEVTPLDQKKTRSRSRSEVDQKKTRSTPTPPTGSAAQGGKAGKGKAIESSIASLPQKQMQRAVLAMEILRSSGLRNPKLKSVSIYLATRIYKSNDEFTASILAALASAYDDDTARDKGMIAAHRLETDQIPAHYRKSKTWNVIPEEVLHAAKIDPAEINDDRWTIKR